MSLGPGSTLGPFKIQSLIGKGGMGEVFSALDRRLDRKVALKILPADFAADSDRLRRFQSEAKALASLNHPNILVIYEVGADGMPYLAAELLEGCTLREELNGHFLPPRKALDYALQIAHGLAAAHARGIIHRDLKPENTFITKDARVKILDFGLAKTCSSPQSSEASTLLQSTVPGLILGTVGYMSPEQVRGESADHRSDIFAFGCILYEMLSGESSFGKSTAAETMGSILKDEPIELSQKRPDISPALNQITQRCLEKSPERRFQSASDLAFALAALSGTTISSPIPRQDRPAASRRKLLTGTVLLLACTLAAFALGRRQRSWHTGSIAAWRGERLDGPTTAFTPRVSPDGKELAFTAMVDGLTQLGLMFVDSGDWKVLTADRSRGMVWNICWAPDGSQIFYDRRAALPNGIFRISKYGGEERPVLENAAYPLILPDNSLFVVRFVSERVFQLFHFNPSSEQIRPLNAVVDAGLVSSVALVPGRRAAIFRGQVTNDLTAPARLWQIDLDSGKTEPVLGKPGAEAVRLGYGHGYMKWGAFTLSKDGRRFIFDDVAESLHRISSVPLAPVASPDVILSLTTPPFAVDLDSSGAIYADQPERPNEILRRGKDQNIERIPLPLLSSDRYLFPLPGDCFLFSSITKGTPRLMLLQPGREPQPFLENKLIADFPVARLGSDRLVFALIEAETNAVLASTSLDGRGVKRLVSKWDGSLSVAGAPDGRTIYYVSGRTVYALPAEGGTPTKIRAGDYVAIDPRGEYLVIKLNDQTGHQLIRFTLSDRSEQSIPISAKYPLSTGALAPNAIARDGRILVTVAPADSWFWPAAILDPKSGQAELLTDYQADMFSAGWDSQERIVTSTMSFRSSIWRFRPEKANAP